MSDWEQVMKATIWHNPKCGTSRNTLELLQAAAGVDVEVIDYLKHPPARDELQRLFESAGMSAREGLRLRGTDAEEQGLHLAEDAIVLDAMAANPALIERPLVRTEKGVRLCRPKEKLFEIL